MKLRLPFSVLSGRKERFAAAGTMGGTAWLAVLLLYSGGLLETYELRTYDQLCRWHATPAPAEIVLVAVDGGSLGAGRQQGINWPWPRQMYAPILQMCTAAGARAVVFDVLFTEPSSYGVEDDEMLAEALKQNGRAFLPLMLLRADRPLGPLDKEILQRIGIPEANPAPRNRPLFLSLIPPVAELAKQAEGLGNVAIPPDSDGLYRRIPLLSSCRGTQVPSLALAAFRQVSGFSSVFWERKALRAGDVRIPLDATGSFLLRFYAERSFQRFSAFNVIQSFQALEQGGQPIYPLQSFRDKIVFVGFTAPGLLDLKPTPVSSVYPGMAIHATLLANLLHRDFRERIARGAVLALALGVAFIAAVTVLLVSSLWLLASLVLGFAIGLLLFIFLAFRLNLWVDGILLFASLGLSFSFSAAFSYATEGRQRRQIKQVFSHYMSDVLIHDLLSHPEKLRLGGERRVLTVFFSDLAGFTTLSEKLAPEEVVILLNRYLTAMTDIILESGGLIDKYEGDAIMAFWGAPVLQEDHAVRACFAALENQARLIELREEFARTGLPPVHARIGINTGEMIIGNMGSSQRFDFTVIGDSVNLASRLEGAGKEYGTRILISEDTFRQAQHAVEVREIDLLRVKGKEVPVRIFELLCRKGELDARGEEVRALFAGGLALYRRREWERAEAAFTRVLEIAPEDGPAKTFQRRCEMLKKTPPPEDWDGVYELTTK